ncbi:hypothetical protein BDV41DRAFT_542994 [Aspergillus transmontanensis]|uniref:Uncharacterized protein n=1 Tax=Aspergillus transmontanensis TaxID=1034304 RepID=A0A5N6VR57_9EURO|nr:hypothetical protein BDV41DRAFT_542994 [Aspergillus transmontanensis]
MSQTDHKLENFYNAGLCIPWAFRKSTGRGSKSEKATRCCIKRKKNIQQEGFAGGHPPNY